MLLSELVSIHAARTGQCGYEIDVATAVELKTLLDEYMAGQPWQFHKALLVELRKVETALVSPPVLAAASFGELTVAGPRHDWGAKPAYHGEQVAAGWRAGGCGCRRKPAKHGELVTVGMKGGSKRKHGPDKTRKRKRKEA